MLTSQTAHENPGYVPVNLARRRSTLSARQEVILSPSTGMTVGNHQRERHVSAKPQIMSSAPLHVIFHGSWVASVVLLPFQIVRMVQVLYCCVSLTNHEENTGYPQLTLCL